jgi:hypothetical protein
MFVHSAIQGKRGADSHFHCPFVQDGQCSRQTEANGTRIRVRRIAELRGAAAENFGFGQELDVDFEADDDLVFCPDFRRNPGL